MKKIKLFIYKIIFYVPEYPVQIYVLAAPAFILTGTFMLKTEIVNGFLTIQPETRKYFNKLLIVGM